MPCFMVDEIIWSNPLLLFNLLIIWNNPLGVDVPLTEKPSG